MRAVRIHEDGGPEVLRYEEAPDSAPGPGEVLVRLRASGGAEPIIALDEVGDALASLRRGERTRSVVVF